MGAIDRTSAGGSETVLVAEDDAQVRGLASRALANAGYRVLVARDGGEAVRLFEDHREAVDLCVLDLVMPKVSGRAAWLEIRRLRPDVPVLFASGYSEDSVFEDGAPEGAELIAKPYQPAELLARVRTILGRRTRS